MKLRYRVNYRFGIYWIKKDYHAHYVYDKFYLPTGIKSRDRCRFNFNKNLNFYENNPLGIKIESEWG